MAAPGNITVQAGGFTDVLPRDVTMIGDPFLLATPLYQYANLDLPFSPNDPGLLFTYQNTGHLLHKTLAARFFNLLDEYSDPIFFDVGSSAASGAISGGLPECLDVRLFGAVGDGKTDDTAAVQAALDRAHQNWLALQAISPTVGASISGIVSGGIIGPTIVCIPTGVYCLVKPTWDDQRDRSGAPLSNCATVSGQQVYSSNLGRYGAGIPEINPILNGVPQDPNTSLYPVVGVGQTYRGFAALLIDDGVTLRIDGGVILGRSPTAEAFMYKNFYNIVYAIQNKNAFIQGPFASSTVPPPSQGQSQSRKYQEFISGSTKHSPSYDIFSGTGSQTVFVLAHTPDLSQPYHVYKDGFEIFPPDFTIVGNVITFATAPLAGINNVEVDYTFQDPGFELGPRNHDILIDGVGFIDCGANAYDTYPTVNLPCVLACAGICFSKCDNSEITTVTLKEFLPMAIYWGHSESVKIHNIYLTDGRDGLANIFGLSALTLDVLRKAAIFQNFATDMMCAFMQVALCHSASITHNKCHRSGSPFETMFEVTFGSTMFQWRLNEDFDSDCAISMNEITYNRSKPWSANTVWEGAEVTIPNAAYTNPIAPGPNGYFDWYVQWSASNDNNTRGYTGGGVTGGTEPAWNNLNPANIDEPVTQVIQEFLGTGGDFNPDSSPLTSYTTFFGIPNDSSQLKVYKNGVLKTLGVDYTLSYATGKITFTAALTTSDIVTASYPVNLTWIPGGGGGFPETGPSYLTSVFQINGTVFSEDGTTRLRYLLGGVKWEHNIITDNDMDCLLFYSLKDSSLSYNTIERNGNGIQERFCPINSIFNDSALACIQVQIIDNQITFYPNYLGGSITAGIMVCADDLGLTIDNPSVDPTTITRGGITQGFFNKVQGEVPSGTINGANKTFHLANSPVTGTLQLYVNGLLESTSSYSLSGNTITFNTAPAIGTTLSADYQWM